jgi:2-hydroxychromene-2-carboxylate isomerase
VKKTVSFYFDFISPYAYFGSTKVDELAGRFGREVEWRPVLLGVTVLKVMGLKPLMETPLKRDYIHVDKPRMASLLGVDFRDHGLKDVDSIAACRAYLYLKSQDPALAKAFARRIFRRLWVDSRNISSPEDIAEEAAALGADGTQLQASIQTPAVKQALRDEVDRAIANGVFGTPYFIVDDQPIWGVDRLWMLEHWLRHGSWEPVNK